VQRFLNSCQSSVSTLIRIDGGAFRLLASAVGYMHIKGGSQLRLRHPICSIGPYCFVHSAVLVSGNLDEI
jgi:hypothetical protein